MNIEGLDHFSISVADLDRSSQWYQEVLGLLPVLVEEWWSEHARFFGTERGVLVALFLRKAEGAFSSETLPVANHHAFRVGREAYSTFKERLTARAVVFREMDHTISHSIYFRDPDGYWLELTTYELV